MSSRRGELVLSEDAAQLLLAAVAADPPGKAYFIPSEQGCSICAGREFIKSEDPHSEPRWKRRAEGARECPRLSLALYKRLPFHMHDCPSIKPPCFFTPRA